MGVSSECGVVRIMGVVSECQWVWPVSKGRWVGASE